MKLWRMESRGVRATVAALLVVTLIGVLGCQPKDDKTSGGTETSPGTGTPPTTPAGTETNGEAAHADLFAGWDQPAAVLILTGDQHGYLEPCGCSDKQSGGLARRADLVRQLKEDRGWNVVPLDGGGLLRTNRVLRDQSKLKLAAILNGMSQIGYKAIGLGYEDLLFGVAELNEAYFNEAAKDGFDMPFVSSNVTMFGTRSDELPPREFRIVEAGDLKIGVTSVLTDTVRGELERTGLTSDPNLLAIAPAVESLPTTVAAMRAAGAELLVLLSHGPIEDSQALSEKFPEFHIVVTARSAEDPLGKTVTVGSSLFVEVGQKGKNVAIVGVYRNPDGKLAVKHRLVEVEQDHFRNHPAMTTVMAEYQDSLQANQEQLLSSSIADPQQGTYVGSEQCGSCHTKAMEVFEQTGHAHAYQSLIDGRDNWEGKWVPRQFDPECLCCHVVGWDPQEATRFASGFTSLEATPHLLNQGCENCHGPGSQHVAAESAVQEGGDVTEAVLNLRKAMHQDLATAEKSCKQCHDYENSPHFEYQEYWDQIKHPGKD